jgi:hypothetical protein
MVARGFLASCGVASIEEAGHILYEQARVNLRVVPGEPVEDGTPAPTPAYWRTRECVCASVSE